MFTATTFNFSGIAFFSIVLSASAASAASIDFGLLDNIPVRPVESEDTLFFLGEPSKGQGYSVYYNPDLTAPDSGHFEISLNAPGFIAPYYATGRPTSPEEPSVNATRSTSLIDSKGFSGFSNYLSGNMIDFSSVGFSFGQKPDRGFDKTWNLGDDVLGQDWFASPDSPIEERIYRASPDDVEIFLVYEDRKFIDFSYTPFYTAFDYGSTTSFLDDIETVISEPLTISIVEDLQPFERGLAEAFVSDVESGGGFVQFVFEDFQVEPVDFSSGNGFNVINLPFPHTLRAISASDSLRSVPEPSSVIGVLALAGTALGVTCRKKMDA